MSKIIVRKAELNDLDILLEFEQGIVNHERPFDNTLKEGEIHYYDLKGMILADNVEVLVAVAGNDIVAGGYARIEEAKDYQKYDRYAYLGFMYVQPGFRGQGVNNMVLDALKDWCRSRDVRELRLEVYTYNHQAIKAYEKAGFKPILTWMRLGLDDQ